MLPAPARTARRAKCGQRCSRRRSGPGRSRARTRRPGRGPRRCRSGWRPRSGRSPVRCGEVIWRRATTRLIDASSAPGPAGRPRSRSRRASCPGRPRPRAAGQPTELLGELVHVGTAAAPGPTARDGGASARPPDRSLHRARPPARGPLFDCSHAGRPGHRSVGACASDEGVGQGPAVHGSSCGRPGPAGSQRSPSGRSRPAARPRAGRETSGSGGPPGQSSPGAAHHPPPDEPGPRPRPGSGRRTPPSSPPASPSRAGRRGSRRCATGSACPRPSWGWCCSRSRRVGHLAAAGGAVRGARFGSRRTVQVMALRRRRRPSSSSALGYLGGVAPVVVGLFLFGFGQGAWDVAMNVQGAVVERRVGRAIMPRFHAGFSVGTVGGALSGAALVGAGRRRHRRTWSWSASSSPRGAVRGPRLRARHRGRPPATSRPRSGAARSPRGASRGPCWWGSSCWPSPSPRAPATTGSASP